MEKRILVVDDNVFVTKTAKMCLEGMGFMVETLNSPFGVFSKMREFRPTLVLMDLNIPGLRGESIVRMLGQKSFDFDYRVVIYSSESEGVLKDAVSSTGAFGYIKKDRPPLEFMQALEYYWRMCEDELIHSAKRVAI